MYVRFAWLLLFLFYILFTGIKKKLTKQSKIRGYEDLKDWIRSISNHLYWCIDYTSEGVLRVAAFTSLFNHITNIHVHPEPFQTCLHGPVNRKWLKPGMYTLINITAMRISKAAGSWNYLLLIRYELFIMHFVGFAGCAVDVWLRKELGKTMLLNDVKQGSIHNTSELESFHSTLNRFAPKLQGLPYDGMFGRYALHTCILIILKFPYCKICIKYWIFPCFRTR